jgi:hypothetical protein
LDWRGTEKLACPCSAARGTVTVAVLWTGVTVRIAFDMPKIPRLIRRDQPLATGTTGLPRFDNPLELAAKVPVPDAVAAVVVERRHLKPFS